MRRSKQVSIAWTEERTELLIGLLWDIVKQTRECKLNKKLCETWAPCLTTQFNYPITPTQIKHKKENMQKEWAFFKTLDGVTGWVNPENEEFDFSKEYCLDLIKNNPRAARYVSKDGYPSFKTLDSIFAHSIALGSLAFGTTSSHAPVSDHLREEENHMDTLGQEEHHIDDVVNDVRTQLNRMHSTLSNGAGGIASSLKSVGKGKRKIKETDEEEDWLKIMAHAFVDSKMKPNA